MDIRIVKNAPGVMYEPVTDGIVLQITEGKCVMGDMLSRKYELFSVNENRKEEIEPEIPKYQLWNIVNLCKPKNYIYFTSCYVKSRGRIEVSLFRYSWEKKETELLYTAVEELGLYPQQKQTRIYALNEDYLLFQNMYLKTNGMENYQGFLDFELFLYSIRDEKSYVVTDQYLQQAGISYMAPIGRDVCAIKAGYNLLKGNGFQYLNEAETVTEKVGFVNIRQMISDILLKQSHIYIDSIDEVRSDKTIPAALVQEDYLIYSRVSREGSEEVIFYHYTDKEVTAGIFPNVFRMEELSKPYVLKGMPCILLENRKGTQLYNLKKEKKEFIFGHDTEVKIIKGDLIVVETSHRRRLFKKPQTTVQVFQYRERAMLVNEKGSYQTLLVPEEGKLYLFLR